MGRERPLFEEAFSLFCRPIVYGEREDVISFGRADGVHNADPTAGNSPMITTDIGFLQVVFYIDDYYLQRMLQKAIEQSPAKFNLVVLQPRSASGLIEVS